jgi:hypothetical protein
MPYNIVPAQGKERRNPAVRATGKYQAVGEICPLPVRLPAPTQLHFKLRFKVAYGMTCVTVSRQTLVRRSLFLNYSTVSYNSLEGLVAISAGVAVGSIALVGFGLDSLIEVSASLAALWRLYRDNDGLHRARAELVTLR